MAKKMSKGAYTAGAPTTGAKAKSNLSGKKDVAKGSAVGTGKSMVKPSYKNPNGKGSLKMNVLTAEMAAKKSSSKGGPSPSGRLINTGEKNPKNPIKKVNRRSPATNPQGKGS